MKQHHDYSEFIVFPDSDWEAARKLPATRGKTYTVTYHEERPGE